jgi:hypothetical protein
MGRQIILRWKSHSIETTGRFCANWMKLACLDLLTNHYSNHKHIFVDIVKCPGANFRRNLTLESSYIANKLNNVLKSAVDNFRLSPPVGEFLIRLGRGGVLRLFRMVVWRGVIECRKVCVVIDDFGTQQEPISISRLPLGRRLSEFCFIDNVYLKEAMAQLRLSVARAYTPKSPKRGLKIYVVNLRCTYTI